MRAPATMAAILLLAACSDASEPDEVLDADDMSEMPETAVSPVAEPARVESAEGPMLLQPLGEEQDVDLGPTLGGCSFELDGDVLLIAGAPDEDTARGRGVIQVAGVDRLLTGEQTGGPEYVRNGPVMTDGEYTVEVRSAGEGEATGIESTQWPAELAVQQGMEAERVFGPGTWTCGV